MILSLPFALIVVLLATISVPAHPQSESSNVPKFQQISHDVPSSAITAFLAGLLIPALCQLVLDALDLVYNPLSTNTFWPYAQIIIRILACYISLSVGLLLTLYGVTHPSFDIGSAGVGVLISVYKSNISGCASSRLASVWKCPGFHRIPPEHRTLLPYALKQLTRLSIRSELWTTMPFKQFLDLVVFSLQLGNANVLDNLFKADTSLTSTSKLRQLHQRIPKFQRLHSARKHFVSCAFGALVRMANETDHPEMFPFEKRVDLVTYCVHLGDEQLLARVLNTDTGKFPAYANRLREIQQRLPDLSCLSETRRHILVVKILKELIQIASDETIPSIPPFPDMVDLYFSSFNTLDKLPMTS